MRPSVERKRTRAAADQGAGSHRATERGDDDIVGVPDAEAVGKFGRHLDEKLGLEFVEVRQETAHRPGRVVLGETVGRQDVGKARIFRRRKLVVRTAEPVDAGIGLAWVEAALRTGDSSGS